MIEDGVILRYQIQMGPALFSDWAKSTREGRLARPSAQAQTGTTRGCACHPSHLHIFSRVPASSNFNTTSTSAHAQTPCFKNSSLRLHVCATTPSNAAVSCSYSRLWARHRTQQHRMCQLAPHHLSHAVEACPSTTLEIPIALSFPGYPASTINGATRPCVPEYALCSVLRSPAFALCGKYGVQTFGSLPTAIRFVSSDLSTAVSR